MTAVRVKTKISRVFSSSYPFLSGFFQCPRSFVELRWSLRVFINDENAEGPQLNERPQKFEKKKKRGRKMKKKKEKFWMVRSRGSRVGVQGRGAWGKGVQGRGVQGVKINFLNNHTTNQPTNRPTDRPTDRTTERPNDQPTNQPTNQPTKPTNQPTNQPTNHQPQEDN